jgi:RNA polymerase sigma factor (sigma-70 family)
LVFIHGISRFQWVWSLIVVLPTEAHRTKERIMAKLIEFCVKKRFRKAFVRAAIVSNAARMHLRRRHSGYFSLDQEQGEEGLTFSERLADSKPSPEEVCSTVEARNRLVEGVQRLSPKHRRAFQLCDIDGLTTKEAAHVLGVPQGTVKAQLARARARLAGIMSGKPVRRRSRTVSVGKAVSTKGVPSENSIWIPVSGPFGLTPGNKGNKQEFL